MRWQSLRRLVLVEPWRRLLGRAVLYALIAALAFFAGWGQAAFDALALQQEIADLRARCFP